MPESSDPISKPIEIDPATFPGVVEKASDEKLGLEAREKALPAMMALHEKEIIQTNIDIAVGVPMVLAFLSRIMTYREPSKQLPDSDTKSFDNLENSALACNYCYIVHLALSKSGSSVEELAESCTKAREIYRADINALIKRGLMDPNLLSEYQGTRSHIVIPRDVQILTYALKSNWPAIESKCAATLEEINKAERDAIHMQRITGGGRTPKSVEAAADERDRSFTLFYTDYDDVRRAISYFRWKHDDLESIAPSLYGNRKRHADREEPVRPVIPIPNIHLTGETNGEGPKVEPENPNMPTGSPFLKK